MIPDAQLPGFVPASQILPKNLDREKELEEQVRQDAAEKERLRELLSRAKITQPAGIKPQEWQALQTFINDLLMECQTQKVALEKQRLTIEELKQKLRDQETVIAFQEKRLDKHSEYILDIKDRLDPEPQPKQKDQADVLLAILAQSNNGKILEKDARRKLGLSKSQFSRLIKTMEGRIESKPLSTDRRQHVISCAQLSTNFRI